MGFKDWLGFKLVGNKWQKMNQIFEKHVEEIKRLNDIISIKNTVIACLEQDNNDLRLDIGKKKLYDVKTSTGKKKPTSVLEDLAEEEDWGGDYAC